MFDALKKQFTAAALIVILATVLKFVFPSAWSGVKTVAAQVNDIPVNRLYETIGALPVWSEIDEMMADFKESVSRDLLGLSVLAVSAVKSGDSKANLALSSPLETVNLSSAYGFRADPFDGGRRFHRGSDFAAAQGTQVFPVCSGVVKVCAESKSYGRYIVVYHGEEVYSLYAHLSEISVFMGMFVTEKTPIGEVGSTGRSTGPHLHLEIAIDGYLCDPYKLINPDVV